MPTATANATTTWRCDQLSSAEISAELNRIGHSMMIDSDPV